MREPITEEKLSEAANPLTSASRLRELAKRPAFHPNLAKNPATPSAVLLELSSSRSQRVRRAVVQNPSAPKEALLALARDYPVEFSENPALPLLLIEHPGLPEEIPFSAWPGLLALPSARHLVLSSFERKPIRYREMIAGYSQAPEDILRQLAAKEPRVQKLVANNHGCPLDTISLLSKSPDESIRADIAKHPRLPAEVIEELSRDPKERVRQMVASRKDLSVAMFARLAQDQGAIVRAQIASNPKTPEEILLALALDPHLAVYEALLRRNTSDALLQQMASHPNDSLRSLLARSTTPKEVLLQLAQDESLKVRQAVASLKPLRQETIPCLIEDTKLWASLASNPTTPPDTLSSLASAHRPEIIAALASNPASTDEILRQLIPYAADTAKQSIALHRSASASLLEMLIHTNNRNIRGSVARHPNASEETLMSLLQDKTLQFEIARNPNCSAPILRQLANDASLGAMLAGHRNATAEILLVVASSYYDDALLSHPNASLALLEKLSNVHQSSIRQRIARHPLASSALLAKLALDKDDAVRLIALRHPNTSIETIQQALRDETKALIEELYTDTTLTGYLARHPNTPTRFLIELSTHHRRRVRRAIALHPKTPREVRLLLSRDVSTSVRRAAKSHLSSRD
jgi:hypothetical protein